MSTIEFDKLLSDTLVAELGIPEDEHGGAMQGGIVQEVHSGNDVGDVSPRPVRVSPALGAGYGKTATSGNIEETIKPLRTLPDGYDAMPAVPGYEVLSGILSAAYQQAATGKGKDRHSTGPLGFQPWHLQPIMSIGRQVGPGGHAYQIAKKAQESVTMQGNGNFAGAKAEALGAIVYAAALYRLYLEMEAANGGTS